jgi:UDP-N-acetylglucosamine 2-epimerase (non-hydrolysing)
MKLLNVVGARPNFMKIAPIMDALRSTPAIQPLLVHTGQHYDQKMSDLFFRDLGIPQPDINLGVGGGSHAAQTAAIISAFEPVLLQHLPEAVLVVGDVNSTIACGLVAVKLGVKLIHVEAGLRSFDRTMPEEINRLLTDSISDLLFCSEQSGVDNLLREGHAPDQVHLVGNVMIDSLLKHRVQAEQTTILDQLDLKPREYAVVTLHRPSNVDQPETLRTVLDILSSLQRHLRVVFPIHPRTRNRLGEFGLEGELAGLKNVVVTDPLGYLEFLKLTASARLVLTDSGGIQEETTILRVPCVTMRDNTERPVTCQLGSNRLAGTQPERVIKMIEESLADPTTCDTVPPLWDGHAAERIVRIIAENSSRWTTGRTGL